MDFDAFVEKIGRDVGDRIVAIYRFGSDAADRHPHLSDRDLLIVARSRTDIPAVIAEVERLEQTMVHRAHSSIALFIERYALGTTDLEGLHLVIMGYDEFAHGRIGKEQAVARGMVTSLRLKILTGLLVSRALFLYELKHESKLVWGKDILHTILVPPVRLGDRVKSFALSFLILLLAPLAAGNRQHFKVWCFKASKCYAHCMETYARIAENDPAIRYDDLPFDGRAYNIAKEYRYKPGEYRRSLLSLYALSWSSFIKNLSFIWRSAHIGRNA